MKKIINVILVVAALSGFVLSTSCGRQPTTKNTVGIMQSYFKKYSKKYPDSVLGKYPVKGIQLLQTEEIHKNFVAAYAILELEGGMGLQTRFTMQKKPLGWRAVSWENMGVASGSPQK